MFWAAIVDVDMECHELYLIRELLLIVPYHCNVDLILFRGC